MGKRAAGRDRQTAVNVGFQGEAIGRAAQQQSQFAEKKLGVEEGLLGTEEQVAGFGYSGGEGDYIPRYEFNDQMIAGLQAYNRKNNNQTAMEETQGWIEIAKKWGVAAFKGQISDRDIAAGAAEWASAQEQAQTDLDAATEAWVAGGSVGPAPVGADYLGKDFRPYGGKKDLWGGEYDQNDTYWLATAGGQGGKAPSGGMSTGDVMLNALGGQGMIKNLFKENPGVGTNVSQNAYQNALAEANTLLDEAQAAFDAGDEQAAIALKQNAADLMDALPKPGVSDESVYSLQGQDAEVAAKVALSSPMARNVGSVVNQASKLRDPNSAQSALYKRAQLAGANEQLQFGLDQGSRALAAGQRGAERGARDMSLALGGANNAMAMRANMDRIGQEYASDDAELRLSANNELSRMIGEVDKWFTGFQLELQGTSASLGQAFLQNQAGVRAQYQAAQDSLVKSQLAFMSGQAQLAADWAMYTAQTAEANSASSVLGGIVGSAIGTTAGAFSGGILGG